MYAPEGVSEMRRSFSLAGCSEPPTTTTAGFMPAEPERHSGALPVVAQSGGDRRLPLHRSDS
jgi:hypothetical protein